MGDKYDDFKYDTVCNYRDDAYDCGKKFGNKVIKVIGVISLMVSLLQVILMLFMFI